MIEPTAILAQAAEAFGVSVADIRSRRRFHRIALARHAVAWALHQRGLGQTEIGELLGRDRSTISTSIKQAKRLAKDDPAFAAKLHRLLADCTPEAPSAPPAPARRPFIITPTYRLWVWRYGLKQPITA